MVVTGAKQASKTTMNLSRAIEKIEFVIPLIVTTASAPKANYPYLIINSRYRDNFQVVTFFSLKFFGCWTINAQIDKFLICEGE